MTFRINSPLRPALRLVGHHVALLWCCVTLGVRRDDESGRQRLARGEPFALGVVQAASTAARGWLVVARWKFLLKSTAISGFLVNKDLRKNGIPWS